MRTVSQAIAVLACLLSFGSDGSISTVDGAARGPAGADLIHSPVDPAPAPTPLVVSPELVGIDEEDNDDFEGPLYLSYAFVIAGSDLTAVSSHRPERRQRSTRAAARRDVLRC